MKKLLLLLFSLLFSLNSYGEWTKVGTNSDNDVFYIDLERIKKIDNYVYWWDLGDYIEPYEDVWTGDTIYSEVFYSQGDCKANRFKELSLNFYKEPMGEKLSYSDTPSNPEWDYYPPESIGETLFDISCRLVSAFVNGYSFERQKIIDKFKVEIENERIKKEFLKKSKEDGKSEDDLADTLIADDQTNTLKSAYLNNISARIKSFWRYQGAEDDWECEVYVVQDRDGAVAAVDIRNCNVDDSARAKAFRDSIRRAVYKASPLPSAPDEAVFDKELVIKFSVN